MSIFGFARALGNAAAADDDAGADEFISSHASIHMIMASTNLLK